MSFFLILGIAVALAMDTLAVSIGLAVGLKGLSISQSFRLAFHFGLFQFLMPIIGYAAGRSIETYIRDYDHWVAVALLTYIGIKMIRESFAGENRLRIRRDPSRGWNLVLLSVATSIDALAVGLSLGVLGKPIVMPSIVIGVVCSLFSIAGIALGRKAGALLGRRVELLGGLILIAIGIKIVVDHLS
jgi:putative Mn2+ efflux pump MntP